jgi:hypothetical protein
MKQRIERANNTNKTRRNQTKHGRAGNGRTAADFGAALEILLDSLTLLASISLGEFGPSTQERY